MQDEKTKPMVKVRKGKFQFTVWRFQRLKHGNPNSTGYNEEIVDVGRACIQYSRFNRARHKWENQSIWFTIEELHDLANGVRELTEGGANPPSSSSSGFPCLSTMVEVDGFFLSE